MSASEKERANRFVFEKDKNRFVISHGLLKKIIGLKLNRDPQSLFFEVGKYGKPRLGPSFESLYFNISHSADLALVAISSDREIGVDVEKMVKKKDLEALVDRFFSNDEITEFKNKPEDQKIKTFYQLWTKKEAFLKAKGVGLSGGLEKQNIKPDQHFQIIHEIASASDQKIWTIQNLDCAEGYFGAVCVEGENCDFQFAIYKNE